MQSRRVQITDTILRDSHQSLIATRMRIDDMLPALEQLDKVGYYSLEMWGGATFDVCMRFLDEDPWERLRTIRKHVKKTRLQMLLRGQNLVGYRHYPDDVVDAFVEAARENGIDVFRIFDALNDIRNLAHSMHAVRRVGGIVEGSISYTVSPAHTIDGFVEFGRQLKDEGAEIICIKDMAGMISPKATIELITALKSELALPIHLHTHCSSGMAPASYLAACQAGVDILDCALSPFSWGTSQPPTESIVGVLAGTRWDTGLDLEQLSVLAQHFQKVRQRYLPILDRRSERVDTRILQHQIPGGMLSNLLSQLKAQKAEDRFQEVLHETALVRRDLGYPPLVTPTSQIVGTQAVFNVILGERYKTVTKEVANYLRGLYGRPPAAVDPELRQKVLGDEQPILCRPADLLAPEMDQHREVAQKWNDTLEEALSCALFPTVAAAFLDARAAGTAPPTTEAPPEDNPSMGQQLQAEASDDAREITLELEGKSSTLQVERPGSGTIRIFLDGTPYDVHLRSRSKHRRSRPSSLDASGDGLIRSEMPGTLLEYRVEPGQPVKKGQVVAVLEAMKMQNELQSPVDGVVDSLHAKAGANLDAGEPILEITPAAS